MKKKATCPESSPVSKAVAASSFLHMVVASQQHRSFLPRNLLKRKRPVKQSRRLSIHSNQMQPDGRMAVRTQKVQTPFGCVFCSRFSGTGTKEDLWVHCLRAHPEYDSHLVQTKRGNKFHLICKQDFYPQAVDWNNRMSQVIFHRAQAAKENNGSRKDLINDEIVQMPFRQYHHSGTLAPMSKATWLLEIDSDDEDDEERAGAYRMREEIIDDFTDVTASQKRFFKHWNRFMSQTRNSIHQQSLPYACVSFVQQYATILQQEKGMEEELISHLTNMHDEGVIGRIHVSEIMSIYNELAYLAKTLEGEGEV